MRYLKLIPAVVLLTVGLCAEAQHMPGDTAVRKGTLENGLTYYICHNENPARRAEFYLATDVGAIQETPDQDGLAHFLEHMCFNGTENFPGKGILNYLQSIGASFGGNVNASTGTEETIYMLNNIPLVNDSVVDSCLLILHDYSHSVSCLPEEIEKERGVILEERRSRRDASWRLYEQAKPFLFGDSKYASCTLIGSEDNLRTFRPESLTTFYHTWYRPDLQAVIVVGDIDVDKVEACIASVWSDVPAPQNPRQKEVITVPVNGEPSVGILTDPEFPNTNIEFSWKIPVKDEAGNDTAPYLVESIIRRIICHAMQERLTELASKADSPFTLARFTVRNLCETMDITDMTIVPKEGRWKESVTSAVTEAERLRRFGLGKAELERAGTEILSAYEMAANKASTRKNSEFISPLTGNFFDHHEYMSPQDKYSFVKGIIPQLPLSMINDYASKLIPEEGLAVLYYATDKEGTVHPAAEQIKEIITSVRASDISQKVEEAVASSFLDPASLTGSAVKKSTETLYGAEEWTLKNGAKVVLLPSDREKDKISIQLLKKGGRSLIADEDLCSFEDNLWALFQSNRGVSSFPAAEVRKMLSGKQVSAQAFISPYIHGVSAGSTSKDLETAFQLAYLQFCDPRFDENEYARTVQMIEPLLGNLENMPQFQFRKEVYKTIYDTPRRPLLSREVLDAASVQTMERVYRGMFNDAAGLVAIIIGDFGTDSIKPLVEKYIGSIPKGRKPLQWCDRGDCIREGVFENEFSVKMLTPKVTVSQVYTARMPYSASLDVSLDALKYILDMVYTETLREDEGGTYGASTTVIAGQAPSCQDVLEIDFETNTGSAGKLRSLAKEALRSISTEGPSADHFDKAVKNLQKKIPENRRRNAYWLSGLQHWYLYGINYIDEYEAAVNALKPEDVTRAAVSMVDSGNFIEMVMEPETEPQSSEEGK